MIELIFRMFNSLLGYLFCLFATTLHFKLLQQETMVRMINHITNTSQSLLENQKTMMGNTAGGPPPTTRIIKIQANRGYGGAVVTPPPPVGSVPVVTTPVIVTYSGAQPSKSGPPILISHPTICCDASVQPTQRDVDMKCQNMILWRNK